MDRFQIWARRESSGRRRLMALGVGAIVFVLVLPCFLVVASAAVDRWLQLSRFAFGAINYLAGSVFAVLGGALAGWSIQTQFSLGQGTPLPPVPTRKLVVQGPFAYCRNPMTLGTCLAYLGLGLWIGSFSAVGMVVIFTLLLLGYLKLVEERELEARFGAAYVVYKQSTSFLLPRFQKRS